MAKNKKTLDDIKNQNLKGSTLLTSNPSGKNSTSTGKTSTSTDKTPNRVLITSVNTTNTSTAQSSITQSTGSTAQTNSTTSNTTTGGNVSSSVKLGKLADRIVNGRLTISRAELLKALIEEKVLPSDTKIQVKETQTKQIAETAQKEPEAVSSSLLAIKGICKSIRDTLSQLGIYDVTGLLKAGATAAKRNSLGTRLVNKMLENNSKIVDEQLPTMQQINLWVRQADLWRVSGITVDAAWLIAQAGVRCVEDLAKCDATHLYPVVKALADGQLTAVNCPTESELTQYIAVAGIIAPKKTCVSNLVNLRTMMGVQRMDDALVRALHAIGIYRIFASDSDNDKQADDYSLLSLDAKNDVRMLQRVYRSEFSGISSQCVPPSTTDLQYIQTKAREYKEKYPNDSHYQIYESASAFVLDVSGQDAPTHLYALVDNSETKTDAVGTFAAISQAIKALNVGDTSGLPQVITGRVEVSDNGQSKALEGMLVQLTGFLTSVSDLSSIQKPVQAYTNANGCFEIRMPEKYNLCSTLTFTFCNADGQQEVSKSADEIIVNTSSTQTDDASVTVVCDLTAQPFSLDNTRFKVPAAEKNTLPSVRLQGEEGSNPVYLDPDTAPSRTFRYNLLQRLSIPCTTNGRETVDSPIDVYGFKSNLRLHHDNICQSGGLSIGYVLGMSQAWVPDGYALGNLLYSLVLAPGEEQRLVVKEHTEAYSVNDTADGTDRVTDYASQYQSDAIEEIFSQTAAQTSAASQSSQYSTYAKSRGTSGMGLFIGLLGGSSSTSKSHGTSSSAASSRNVYSDASQAAERFQTSIVSTSTRLAQTNRVSIRAASSSDSESVASKVVANHNHSHVMTVQYWEVMRRYKLQTCIENVKLVLFVPLKLIPFYAGGDLGTVDYSVFVQSEITPIRFQRRYAGLVRYADVLEKCLSWNHRRSLTLCRNIFTTPSWKLNTATSDVYVRIKLCGNLIDADIVEMTLRTSDGQVFYPEVRNTDALKSTISSYQPTITSTSDLSDLVAQKRNEVDTAKTGNYYNFRIPAESAADETFTVEVTHRCKSLTVYTITEAERKSMTEKALQGLNDKLSDFAKDNTNSSGDIKDINHYDYARKLLQNFSVILSAQEVLNAADLNVQISIESTTSNDKFTLSGVGSILGSKMRFTLCRKGSTYFSKDDLRRVEELYQHVLANTYDYSRFVWEGMSDGERVLMLEGYTIDLDADADGTSTATSYPLLNCVDALSPLGFYGNNIVLPFYIPDNDEVRAALGKELFDEETDDFTSATLQDRIYKFQSMGFRVPTATVSVPTSGMIGEAVLGETNVSEKIDITRFWNWKDSDIDHATLDSSYLTTNSLLSSANANAPTLTMPTQGATLPQHIQSAGILASLAKSPQFAEALASIDMRELLKTADTNTATGRDNIVKANSEIVNTAVKTAGTVITSLLGAKSGSGNAAAQEPKKDDEAQKGDEAQKTDEAQKDDTQKCEDTQKTDESQKADTENTTDTESNVCSNASSEKSESQSTNKE